jgi:hypothetical protein
VLSVVRDTDGAIGTEPFMGFRVPEIVWNIHEQIC